MSQEFLTVFSNDLDKVTSHSQESYPEDEIFQKWIAYYTQTGRAGLEEMINPPPQVQKRPSQDDLDKKKEKQDYYWKIVTRGKNTCGWCCAKLWYNTKLYRNNKKLWTVN